MEKALSAKTVRDFEKAISMVSYGFDAIEDFYSESSTRGIVGNVKIPVLFIQVHILYFHCYLPCEFCQDNPHVMVFDLLIVSMEHPLRVFMLKVHQEFEIIGALHIISQRNIFIFNKWSLGGYD